MNTNYRRRADVVFLQSACLGEWYICVSRGWGWGWDDIGVLTPGLLFHGKPMSERNKVRVHSITTSQVSGGWFSIRCHCFFTCNVRVHAIWNCCEESGITFIYWSVLDQCTRASIVRGKPWVTHHFVIPRIKSCQFTKSCLQFLGKN